MLAQLAARLRARQGGAGGAGGGVVLGDDGEAVIVDDNCSVRVWFTESKLQNADYTTGHVTTQPIKT